MKLLKIKNLNIKDIRLLIKFLVNRDLIVTFRITSVLIISFDQDLLRVLFCHVNNFVNITLIEKLSIYNM